MICTVLQHKTHEQILSILDDPWVEMAEVRLDLCSLTNEQIEDIFSGTDKPLIATCRIAQMGEQAAWERLSKAIESGARYADLEIEASAELSKKFQALCHESGTEVVRSFHDFSGTPDKEYLQQVLSRCYRYGADIAKIVVTASSKGDCAVVESLYEGAAPGRLVAFAMGSAGSETRIDCLKLGAPFSYAAFSADETPAAAGQIPFEQMHPMVYGSRKGFFRNDIALPASKSFAQRAIICAALAEGRSHLRGYSPCDDSEAALKAAAAMGAGVRKDGRTVSIDGIGRKGAAPQTALQKLHVGESGLLTRLSIPLLAAINKGPVTIEGTGTLLNRPLKGVQDIMAAFGVAVREEKVPLTVAGPLIPGRADISGRDGSQLISGLLTALPLCGKPSTIYVDEPKSIPYMFITTDVLARFGVKVSSEMEGDEALLQENDWGACTQITFNVRAGRYRAADISLEADWSAAANFLVAGAIFGKVELEGLDTSSLQADISICDILVQAGALVSEMDDLVCVSRAPLEAFEADLANSPDIFPIVSVLAAFCAGESSLSGLGRLRGKESDRAAAIVQMLTQFGVPTRVEGDVLHISGEQLTSRILNGRLLKGGTFPTHNDHRMAMALQIASMGADSPVVQDCPECVSKSFPEFWGQFDALPMQRE